MTDIGFGPTLFLFAAEVLADGSRLRVESTSELYLVSMTMILFSARMRRGVNVCVLQRELATGPLRSHTCTYNSAIKRRISPIPRKARLQKASAHVALVRHGLITLAAIFETTRVSRDHARTPRSRDGGEIKSGRRVWPPVATTLCDQVRHGARRHLHR